MSTCPTCQTPLEAGQTTCPRCAPAGVADLVSIAVKLNAPDGGGLTVAGRYRLTRAIPCANPRFYLFEAADTAAGDRTVLLRILPMLDPERDREAARLLETEASRMGGLDHPRIRKVGPLGSDGILTYLVCEHVAGGSLAELVRSNGRARLEDVARWVKDAAEGLQVAHDRGIHHLDVKPTNLLWERTADGPLRIKVADFEALVAVGPDGKVDHSRVFGSAPYMAPELLEGRPVDATADVYALSCSAYFLLTGRDPYPVYADEWRAHEVLDPGTYPIPEGMEDRAYRVLRRGFDKERAQRYARVGDLVDALEVAAGLRKPPTPRVEESDDEEPAPRGLSWHWAILGAIVLLAGGVFAGARFGVALGLLPPPGPAYNLLVGAVVGKAPSVIVDGKPQAEVPALLVAAPGDHKVEAKAGGQTSGVRDVKVSRGSLTRVMVEVPPQQVAPATPQGLVVAATDPTWQLFVDGSAAGSNPAFVAADPGDHKVNAVGSGAPVTPVTVKVAAGSVAVAVVGAGGGKGGAMVAVLCPEPRATLVLDGQTLDLAESLGFFAVEPGEHTLKVAAGTRSSAERRVVLRPGQGASLRLHAAPPGPGETVAGWGTLRVTLVFEPDTARPGLDEIRVLVDGHVGAARPVAADALELAALAGTWRVRVEAPGTTAFETRVTVPDAAPAIVQARLVSEVQGGAAALARESVEQTGGSEPYSVYRPSGGADPALLVYVPPGLATLGEGAGDGRGLVDCEVPGFYIYRQPVSEAQWNQFVGATRQGQGAASGSSATQPYFGISLEDAQAYCRWSGTSLPTEAELVRALAPPPGSPVGVSQGDWFVSRFGVMIPSTNESGEWCLEGPRLRETGIGREARRLCLRPARPMPVR